MLRYLLISCLALILSACNCNKSSSSNSCYYDDGSKKPVVTIVPMLDSSSCDVPWSLSEEFSSTIKNELAQDGALFLSADNNLQSTRENPFNHNLAWVKKSFKPAEFVVFMELVEHENVPLIKTVKDPDLIPEFRKNASNLNLAVRIRIIDIRKDEPVIVLQEILKNSYYSNNMIDYADYSIVTWGAENYKNTPMEIAHREMISNLKNRISDYIKLAKTR